jgi:phage host-nuclease inhibitor protein Gam
MDMDRDSIRQIAEMLYMNFASAAAMFDKAAVEAEHYAARLREMSKEARDTIQRLHAVCGWGKESKDGGEGK